LKSLYDYGIKAKWNDATHSFHELERRSGAFRSISSPADCVPLVESIVEPLLSIEYIAQPVSSVESIAQTVSSTHSSIAQPVLWSQVLCSVESIAQLVPSVSFCI